MVWLPRAMVRLVCMCCALLQLLKGGRGKKNLYKMKERLLHGEML